MKKRYFPYKLNGKVFKDTPPFAATLWPNLPLYLQKAFIKVFEQDEIFGINDFQGIQRCSKIPSYFPRFSKILEGVRRCSKLFDDFRRCSKIVEDVGRFP